VGYLCANFSLPIGLSVLELGPMYATDRRETDRRQTKASLNASALWGRGGITRKVFWVYHAACMHGGGQEAGPPDGASRESIMKKCCNLTGINR